MKSPAAQGRLSYVLCLWLAACGGGQTAGATVVAPALPPLPDSPLAAMPVQAEAVVALDVEKLRGTQPGEVLGRVRSRSCLAGANFSALWNGTEAVAMTRGSDPALWALSLAGPAVTSEGVIAVAQELGVVEGAASPFAARRLAGQRFGEVVVAELGPKTVLVASVAQATSLAQTYDAPTRYRPAPEIALPLGLANVWDRTGEMSKPWLRTMPLRAAQAALGAPLSARADADANGLSAQLRAQLEDPVVAKELVDDVHSQLRSAALMFRLLGLPPLDNRLQGQVSGSAVEFDVHIRPDETSRLMRLIEDQLQKALSRYCGQRGVAARPKGRL